MMKNSAKRLLRSPLSNALLTLISQYINVINNDIDVKSLEQKCQTIKMH